MLKTHKLMQKNKTDYKTLPHSCPFYPLVTTPLLYSKGFKIFINAVSSSS